MSDRPPLLGEGMWVTLLYSALTFILAYPLTIHPGTTALPLGGDTHLYVWTLGWDLHALRYQPFSIFDANMFYPYRHTLAYSENLIGSALVAAPWVWLTGNVVLGMNAVALLSCVLCGTGAYVLARRVGVGRAGAVLSGLIFAFAPPRFFRIGQLFLTTVQWIPFCLASLHAYLDFGRRRDLWWACAFFSLQALTSGHGAVFVALSVAMLVAWRTATGRLPGPGTIARDLGLPGVLLLTSVVPVFWPYLVVQREMGLKRTLDDGYAFAPSLVSYFASPTHVHAYLLSVLTDVPVLGRATGVLFPGYVPLVLAGAALWPISRRVHRVPTPQARAWIRVAWIVEIALLAFLIVATIATLRGGIRLRAGSMVLLSARQPWRLWVGCTLLAGIRLALLTRAPFDVVPRLGRARDRFLQWAAAHGYDITFYGLFAALFLWLSVGPGGGLYRLVYWWPGFDFVRVPARYTILTVLGLSVLAAAGFERWSLAFAPKTRWVLATLAGALLVGEFAAFPLGVNQYSPETPAIERWLAAQPKPFVVAEFPDREHWHALYLVHSMVHWQKTVEGYSGMRPPLHEELFKTLVNFPDEKSLARLEELRVTYLVVHRYLYPPDEWTKVENGLRDLAPRLNLEHEESDGRVYTIRSRP